MKSFPLTAEAIINKDQIVNASSFKNPSKVSEGAKIPNIIKETSPLNRTISARNFSHIKIMKVIKIKGSEIIP
ncbi:hypothetical protein COJ65_15325 [Bacillus cereus]|nr:hypothetical protein COJ65_15325 [Bacillus cereus]